MGSESSETKKSQVEREFGARAEAYVKSATHAQGNDLVRLVELAQPGPETAVLDIATGGGHTALAMARHARSVIASDLSQQMLDSAEAYMQKQGITNVEFAQADTEALPFADASFDLVTCRIAPHHFTDVAKAVREWARVLKPGGKVVLEDSVAPADPDLSEFINTIERLRDYTHARTYSEQEWLAFFATAGLHVIHTEPWQKTHPFQDWMERGAMLDRERDWARVVDLFHQASPEIRSAFKLTFDTQDNPTSFADEKIIIVAQKPESY